MPLIMLSTYCGTMSCNQWMGYVFCTIVYAGQGCNWGQDRRKKWEISDEVMTTEKKVLRDNSTLSPYQIALKKSIWYFFSNVISWFSSKVHKQSVVMNFVLDEIDLEVNFLWVLSFTIRNLALSFSLPTHSSFMTTACDTKHNLCRLVKSMIIRDGSLLGVLLLETMWDHLAILFPALTYVPSLLLILFKIKACEVITSFIKLHLILLTFQLHSVGDETRIWAKLGPKCRVTIWISTSFYKIKFFS
jgi:hypothetical protein